MNSADAGQARAMELFRRFRLASFCFRRRNVAGGAVI
jgi:hypothetical protein